MIIKLYNILQLSILAVFFPFFAHGEEMQLQIVENTYYLKDEVKDIKDGETWFAITPKGNDYKAKKVTISAKTIKYHDEMGNDGIITAKSISSDKNAVFLIKGMKFENGAWIKNYPFTRYPLGASYLQAEKSIEITGGKEKIVLTGIGGVNFKIGSLEKNNGYKLIGMVGNKEFIIIPPAEADHDYMPSLIWAGDLNNDGYPDLFLNTSIKNYKRHVALFMSQSDKNGTTYSKLAERTQTLDD